MQEPACAGATRLGAGLKAPSGYRVRWPKPREIIRGTFLCRRPEACWTHFIKSSHFRGGITKPCPGRAFGCEWCRSHALELWIVAGFLDELAGRVGILKVTVEAARCNQRFLDPRTDLRGFSFSYSRLGDSPNGRCVLELDGRDKVSNVKVPPPNAYQTLMHLWGMEPNLMPLDELTEGI